MNSTETGEIFIRITELWPEWTYTNPEKEEWMKAIYAVYGKAQGLQAVSEMYAASQYKKPTLKVFIASAKKAYLKWKSQNIKSIEPVLLYTISKTKAEPGRLQTGHQYYGKPNQPIQEIERQAQKALETEKQLYGEQWSIIVYSCQHC